MMSAASLISFSGLLEQYQDIQEEIRVAVDRVLNSGWYVLGKEVENFEKEFESITDTIKYFGTLNIKLHRKALYLHLKDGKNYKTILFL